MRKQWGPVNDGYVLHTTSPVRHPFHHFCCLHFPSRRNRNDFLGKHHFMEGGVGYGLGMGIISWRLDRERFSPSSASLFIFVVCIFRFWMVIDDASWGAAALRYGFKCMWFLRRNKKQWMEMRVQNEVLYAFVYSLLGKWKWNWIIMQNYLINWSFRRMIMHACMQNAHAHAQVLILFLLIRAHILLANMSFILQSNLLHLNLI